MHSPSPPAAPDDHDHPAWLGATRIGIGLGQGLVLYLLYRAAKNAAWPATEPLLFAPLVLAALLAPVLLISGLGHMPRRRLLPWAGIAAAVTAAFGVYDVWRAAGMPDPQPWRPVTPSMELSVFLAAGLFIAHALVLSGSHDRRRIASYATYFELAWKLGVQLAFSTLFVGAAWVALQLGAALFQLVRLDFMQRLAGHAWFAIPVTAFAFACAMHLTDVKPGIVRGIRNLAHVLLAWILPVLALLVAGFIGILPFTGLEPLWATRSAAAVLLGAMAAFVILINAAWQDGATPAARVVALSARVASILLAPLAALAIYALALRVHEHGWTNDRIIATACLLVASCYAGGYAAAALRKGGLRGIAGVNIATAFVVLGVLLALFSPVADPARLSVKDQLARLEAGRLPLEKFDFAYLHQHGGRFGREALARLEANATGPDQALVRARLAQLQQSESPRPPQRPLDLADNLRVYPQGARLPDSFLASDWTRAPAPQERPACLRQPGIACDAFVLDLGGDARPEVILVGAEPFETAVFREAGPDRWQAVGSLPPQLVTCPALRQALRDGKVRVVPPAMGDLEIAGQRVPVQELPDLACRPAPPAVEGGAARQ
ncbi:DUF4153 domain-containing protein [Massilia niastensis]|uniref:DUF4153 domain-containing protein n=1 Tax=Massilia niastensis TaxID=544911 RepID=UPI0003768143|nr:DUF4153 domain-containing protein [Massilia niastensis]